MKIWKLAACVPFVMVASMAQAAPDYAEVQEILTKNACLACHAVDKKMIGPAYREVAKQHEGEADAAEVIATHIREGSTGIYGPIPMPPNPGITDDDLAKVVEWVLAGAPE